MKKIEAAAIDIIVRHNTGQTSPAWVDLARWLTSHEPERGPLSVCMHRPEARTVSRTLVEVAGDSAAMRYLDGSPCEPAAPEVRRTLRLRPR